MSYRRLNRTSGELHGVAREEQQVVIIKPTGHILTRLEHSEVEDSRTMAKCSQGINLLFIFRKVVMHACWADAVAEFGSGMIGDILIDLFPEAFVVPDLFAVGADGYDTL